MNISLDKVENNRTTTNSSSERLGSAGTIVISFAVTILAVVTVVGNIFVIIAFKRNRRLRIFLSNYFLVSLAVTDTMIGLVCIPLYSVYLLIGYWPFGAVVCDILLCLDNIMTNASVAHLLVICFDRYLAIFRPMAYKTRQTQTKVYITIAIVWIVSFLLWAPWIISWPYIEGQRTVPETECYVQFLLSSPGLSIVTSLVAFYIPMLIMILLYVCIYRKILLRKKHIINLRSNGCNSSNANIKNNANLTFHKQVCNSCFNRCAISICCMRVVDVDGEIPVSSNFVELNIMQLSENVMSLEANKVIRTSATAAALTTAIMDNRGQTTNIDDTVTTSEKDRTDSNRDQKQDRKAAKVISALLIAFLVTWLPHYILAVLYPFCSTCVNDTTWYIAFGLCYINSTVNPFLYALCNVDFRREYCNILTCPCRQLQ